MPEGTAAGATASTNAGATLTAAQMADGLVESVSGKTRSGKPAEGAPAPDARKTAEQQAEDGWFTENLEPERRSPTSLDRQRREAKQQEANAKAAATRAENKAAEAEQKAKLTDDDRHLLKRHHVPERLVESMTDDERADLLGNLKKQSDYIADLQRRAPKQADGNEDEAKSGANQEGQQQQPPQRAKREKSEAEPLWKSASDYFGDEHAGNVRKAVETHVNEQLGDFEQLVVQNFNALEERIAKAVKPLNDMVRDLAARLEQDDIEAAIEALELPEGVDKRTEEVRKRLLDAAIAKGVHPLKSSYRALIPQVARELYDKEIKAAERVRREQRGRELERGSPTKTTTVQTRQTGDGRALSEKQREDRFFEATKRGLTGAARTSFINAGAE